MDNTNRTQIRWSAEQLNRLKSQRARWNQWQSPKMKINHRDLKIFRRSSLTQPCFLCLSRGNPTRTCALTPQFLWSVNERNRSPREIKQMNEKARKKYYRKICLTAFALCRAYFKWMVGFGGSRKSVFTVEPFCFPVVKHRLDFTYIFKTFLNTFVSTFFY